MKKPLILSKDILLYEGKSEIILPIIEDESIDLTITSPPYDKIRKYHNYTGFDFKKIAHELFRVTKPGGVLVWVIGDQTINGSETLTSARNLIYFADICGFNVHDTMIYKKSGFNFPMNNRYHQIFEYMYVFSKGTPKTFNPICDRRNFYPGQVTHSFHRTQNGKKNMSVVKAKPAEEFGKRFNIWEYNTGGGQIAFDKIAHEHEAIFPEKLAYDHIISWSNEGDTILDCFAGSGTTLKAAMTTNRKAIGIEMSSKYCKLIKRRLDEINPLFQ